MPANVTLTLDTQGPDDVTLSIEAGAAFSSDAEVILNVGTSSPDAAEMLVWGDLAGGPATEGEAVWQAYNPALPVTLSAAEGSKTVHVRLRDDVHNPSASATDSIFVDLAAPTVELALDPTRISKQPDKRTSDFTVTPSEAIQAWKVKVVPAANSTEGQGTQIPTTNGSVNVTGGASGAGVPIVGSIDGADLELAGVEGDNTIKAFVQDLAGRWSIV